MNEPANRMPPQPTMYELIRRKRDRGRLSERELDQLVGDFTSGKVPDYQMAAWLMATWFRGLSQEETSALTMAMMHSGDVFDLSDIPGHKVDKHSTGGVGDKVSLILAPLVAACGVVVPMVSGRSLGHTGGTLDKLESIPGFRTDLKYREFRRSLEHVGVAMMGQTDRFCPADRRMYALRDVTATVDSIPLIAASIMSKKLAEGINGLVLDVKTGTGAFMSRPAQARRLARTMIAIGNSLGKKVVALVTAMWEPLGETVGNSLEVVESIEALKGRWRPDLEEVTLALGAEMLVLGGRATTVPQARRLLLRALTKGKGLEKLRQMIEAQGGDVRVVDDYGLLPSAHFSHELRAESVGHVRSIDALQVGLLGVELGTGRATMDARIDPGAGFRFYKKVGDRVAVGEPLASVFSSDSARAESVARRLSRCIVVSGSAPRSSDMVVVRLSR
jgi:pyrimidine-nucleoside phosphorylase